MLWFKFTLFSLLYWFGIYNFFAIGYNYRIPGAVIVIPVVGISFFIWAIIQVISYYREIKDKETDEIKAGLK